MSMQQVNLLQDELKVQKSKYSAQMLVQISIVIVVVFSLLTAGRYFQLQQRQSSLVEHKEQQKVAMADLQKLQAELSLVKKDSSLVKQIAAKSKELTNKQKVLGVLSQDQFGNTEGFIQHISGLARQRIEGLWLTQIRIAAGGSDVALQGTTSKSSLLPKYLQRLSAEKAFSGTEFESLLMARNEKKKQWLNFSLKNIKTSEVTAK